MDFFDRQEAARKRTKWLVLCFTMAVLAIIASVYLAIAGYMLRGHYNPNSPAWLWDPDLFLVVAAGCLCVIGGGTLYKLIELRQPGSAVAASLGGTPVSPNTADPDERKLLNVVEEMAIASGTPVPAVYLLQGENSINAFAAGHAMEDAAVGVTRGCIRLLSRDELQGVVAHEFSHILNGDMRLNLRLMGVVHGLLCLALVGRFILDMSPRSGRRSGSSRDKGANVLPLLGLALLVLGYIGVFFGRLIKSGVSRQREFLADAAAVQFTRNPSGLAGALKKIGGLAIGSRIGSPVAEEASHLFFGNALAQSWFGLMSTHPPLVERIKAIDPQFDGQLVSVGLVEGEPEGLEALSGGVSSRLSGSAPRSQGAPGARPRGVVAAGLVPSIGEPGPGHLRYAASLLADLPQPLVEAAREPFGATALVYSLLLAPDEAMRASQLTFVDQRSTVEMGQETRRLIASVVTLTPGTKLALMDLALPALRQMSAEQYLGFSEVVHSLVEMDREMDLFEYTLLKVIVRRLDPHFRSQRPAVIQYYALRPLLGDCAVLLSALAHVGQEDAAQKLRAFQTGAARLRTAEPGLALLDYADCGLEPVDTALNHLCQAAFSIRRIVLDACAYTAASDGFLQENELQLLRAIADALDCPMPPVVSMTGDSQ